MQLVEDAVVSVLEQLCVVVVSEPVLTVVLVVFLVLVVLVVLAVLVVLVEHVVPAAAVPLVLQILAAV